MKTTTQLTLLILALITFNSCGGGSCPATTQVLAINAHCNINNDMSQYTPLQSGDIITKEEDNTLISIFHDQDNNKVVCIESGKASIIRGGV